MGGIALRPYQFLILVLFVIGLVVASIVCSRSQLPLGILVFPTLLIGVSNLLRLFQLQNVGFTRFSKLGPRINALSKLKLEDIHNRQLCFYTFSGLFVTGSSVLFHVKSKEVTLFCHHSFVQNKLNNKRRKKLERMIKQKIMENKAYRLHHLLENVIFNVIWI